MTENSPDAIEKLEKVMEATCKKADASKAGGAQAKTGGRVKDRIYMAGSKL